MAKSKEPEEEIYLSEDTTKMLERLSYNPALERGCFLCTFILEDQIKNGKLTGHPKNWGGDAQFPVSAKIRHIELERMHYAPPVVEAPGIGEDLQ